MAKIESLEIEARGLSVPVRKARQPWIGKGSTAEAENLPEVFCWFVREYLPDCHKLLWRAIDCSGFLYFWV